MNRTQTPAWTLGDRIRKARKSAGMTQAQLAAAIGDASATSVNNWETGASKPRELVDTCRAIAVATGVPFEWVLLGDQEPAGSRYVKVA